MARIRSVSLCRAIGSSDPTDHLPDTAEVCNENSGCWNTNESSLHLPSFREASSGVPREVHPIKAAERRQITPGGAVAQWDALLPSDMSFLATGLIRKSLSCPAVHEPVVGCPWKLFRA